MVSLEYEKLGCDDAGGNSLNARSEHHFSVIPNPASQPAAMDSGARQPVVFRAGTLSYSRTGLTSLFICLLAGDFFVIVINQIEPVLLPVLLKQHGASDHEIALLISSVPAGIKLMVSPVVGYASDRTRTRWGRRLPYLALATPLVTLFLLITPFAPEIAQHTGGGVVLTFGLLIGLYQLFQCVIDAIYYYLLRDVVPMAVMGRFLSLMRIFSALGLFTLNYWLLGLIETHPRAIFAGVAGLNLIGMSWLCLVVREGEYEKVVDKIQPRDGLSKFGPIRAILNFAGESFSHPVYRWTYLSRLLIYASMPMSGFVVFFARDDLGLALSTAGKYIAWSAIAWLPLAYLIGRLMDRWGPMRVMQLGLALGIAGYIASFFLITGPRSFLVATLITGTAFWIVMLAQVMLAQVIFHPLRMGQLSSANALVQSIVIAAVTGPASGFLIEAFRDTHWTLPLPGLGVVSLTHYRFIYLVLAVVYTVSLMGLFQVRRHWLRLGGPAAYQPPL